MSESEDFFLLQPEDEWVEWRLSRPRSWRTPELGGGDEAVQRVPAEAVEPPPPDLPWWWWDAWTAVGLVLWVVVCVALRFPSEIGGLGAILFLVLRWRARLRQAR